jgi:hypothetical protein
MAVGSNADSQQAIHISHQDTTTAAPLPAVFTNRAEEERWMQLLTALAQDENKAEMIVPESLLRLYHQMLSKKDSSARLHATWLLAELVQLAVPGKAGERSPSQAEAEQGHRDVKLSAGNSDDEVVQTVEDDCGEGSGLRTSSNAVQEDKQSGHGSDEL